MCAFPFDIYADFPMTDGSAGFIGSIAAYMTKQAQLHYMQEDI